MLFFLELVYSGTQKAIWLPCRKEIPQLSCTHIPSALISFLHFLAQICCLLPMLLSFSQRQHNLFIQIPPKTHCFPSLQWSQTMPKYQHTFFPCHFREWDQENGKGKIKLQKPLLIPSSNFPRASDFICMGFLWLILLMARNVFTPVECSPEYLTQA